MVTGSGLSLNFRAIEGWQRAMRELAVRKRYVQSNGAQEISVVEKKEEMSGYKVIVGH
ncbi:hypothetical protein [Chitinophaga filiformis]|uniref:hypothetical protein n=1 Tax=Chitinophaga filiformis TaxID=104663 RepID=UPI0015A1D31E|nr:hypothetical protein [Chitinophaga filiformis]